ncbi:MAG TPA: peptide chain release factor 1 [Thermoanaerobaculia bacterium]|jgi:peptide chain release factor 1|nr:peptide chain release factor 1 [Thermoanaerobaculia bacterium]
MIEKLQEIENQYAAIQRRLEDPNVAQDYSAVRQAQKALSEFEPIVEKYRAYRKAAADLEGARQMMASLPAGDELHAMAAAEAEELRGKLAALEEELRLLLVPRDPNDAKNVILEIRGGTGGEEASLFAADLLRMYQRYAEGRGWKFEVIDLEETGLRGVKSATAIVEGEGAYSRLKYEGGVHRVQRVPQTEASGRIHTSAATVAVMPEAEDVDVEVHEKDLRVDRFCASGPGGQGVNTTYSAVRLTHLPTGIVVQCQDERSQIKNKAKALRVLKARLLEAEQEKQQGSIAAERKKMVGSGDRSEKIRTYNFPQSRVTDHRIGVTSHRLQEILDGRLDELVEPLTRHFRAEKLREQLARA